MTAAPSVSSSSIDIDDAMHTWLRWCANPLRVTDVAAAIAAGLLTTGGDHYRYIATPAGREWLIANAIANGATRSEAIMGLDYIEGA